MNSDSYDIITIGGGLAGAAVALKMAEAGARVLVLERTLTFSDRVRGEWLAPWGVREANALGLADVLAEAEAHELPSLAGRSLKPRRVATPLGDLALTSSHPLLQEKLLARAAAAGAVVVRGARVTEVKQAGRAIVSYFGPEGPAVAYARLAVGADGRSSLSRQALGRAERTHSSARVLAGLRLENVQGDDSVGYFIVSEEAGGHASLFPQGRGFARAYVFERGTDAAAYAGAGGLAKFMGALTRLGVPAAAIEQARAAGPLGAFVADDTWVEHPASGSIALVGDAAGVSDPTWGMGTALVMRDARVLSELLRSRKDWRAAAHSYARQRDRYYNAIITAERWQTEIQLTPGVEAAERRKAILQLWSREPDRAIDLPGLGPAIDVSEMGRMRAFGDDLVAPNPALTEEDGVATRFLTALQQRDFGALKATLHETMRMRALLPGGPHEFSGADAAIAAFEGWFGDVAEFALEGTEVGRVADRVRMAWRCRVRWQGEKSSRLVEQQAYAKVSGGRIVVLDVLCSGFRTVAPELSMAA